MAALVLRVRPRRAGSGLLATVLVTNGGITALSLLSLRALDGLLLLANFATILPLTLFAWNAPWPRGTRLARGAVVGVLAALLALAWAPGIVGGLLGAPPGPEGWPGSYLFGLYLIHGSAILCVVLALDATLSAQGPLERRVGATLLVAFTLRVAATGITTLAPASAPWTGLADDPRVAFDHLLMGSLYAGLWGALALVVLVLAINRVRGGQGAGSWTADALVVACIPLGLWLGWGLGLPYAEFTLLRPILLVYAVLQFQMLGADIRRSEGLIGIAALVGLLAFYLLVERATTAALGNSSLAVALVATLGLAGLLVVPLLRIVLHPAEADAPRRLLVYRAALEAAQRDGDAGASETLKALRRELGVSDKEHALLAGLGRAEEGGSALVPGTVILDRYRVMRPLGRGASGEVVLARDERLSRDVAVKRLAGHIRRDARAVQSFEREMRLASALHHPNVVAIHDVETIGDDAFLIMEYMPGGSLQDRIDASRLAEGEAVPIARDVLAALAALHEKGIVHRDVKPSNVLLDASGRAKLADFTIARDAVSGETIGGASERPVGTIAYMSPEQARGLRATARSDLYSLAATLYASLAGTPPVVVEGLDEHGARMSVAREAPALPLAGVSARTNAALARGLTKSPGERFQSAREMSGALL